MMELPAMVDQIYAHPLNHINRFEFDEEVVQVFSDMVTRSIPGYRFMLPLIGLIAARYVQPNTTCYDLGCSLGAVTLSMRQHIRQDGCRIVAIDSSKAMINRCQEVIDNDAQPVPVVLVQDDIGRVSIENASVVVLNFTLQFIEPGQRDRLMARIFAGLNQGGALILSEKIVFDDQEQNERFIELHHDFKRANGYSDLEISQKRTALENVLVPETIDQHRRRLLAAGFSCADIWFQAYNFISILALK